MRTSLLRFKNGHDLALARPLGWLLAEIPMQSDSYDMLVPVPLHVRRLRERGFNQSVELARPLARRLGIPLNPWALRRTGYTHPQAGLHLAARRENVRGLFAAHDVAGKRILLVDDIVTTCATVESAATALCTAGAAVVDVACLARTPF